MKRLTLLLGAFTAFVLLTSLVVAGWLVGTTGGARFLLMKAAESSGASLRFTRIEGRLLDELRLEQTTIATGSLSLRAGALRLTWNPVLLLTGNLAIKKLDLRDVEIRDLRPPVEKPIDLTWPKISGPALRMNGWISSLNLRNLSYRQGSGKPTVISEINGRADWHGGRAALTRLTIKTPEGTVTGDAGISFRQPFLDLFATVTPATESAGFSRLLIHAELSPGKGAEQASGSIRALATVTGHHTLQLSTAIGLTEKTLSIRNLSLSEVGRQGKLTGTASVSFAEQTPALQLNFQAEKLDISPEVPGLPLLDGSIDLSGSIEDYRGAFRFVTRGSGIRSGSLAGTVSGTWEEITLRIDRGTWLDGTLTGTVHARWIEGLDLAATLSGRNIQPSRISPDWDGVINLDAEGKISKPDAAPLRGKIEASLLASRIRGRQLTGELSAGIDDQDIIINRLLLRGKGFDIKASGNLARKIDFALLADDLGGLVPESAGTLRLNGELRRRDGRFGGTLKGSAGNLRIDSLRAGSAILRAELSASAEQSLELQLAAQNVSYDKLEIQKADLDIRGTLLRHRISLAVTAPGVAMKASLEGKYANGSWLGYISSLSGTDGIGPWRLEQPAALAASSRRISLSSLRLTGSARETVDVRGEWFRNPTGLTLNTNWQNINLARIGQWLPDLLLSGYSSGKLDLTAPPGSPPQVSGTMETTGSISFDGHKTQLRRGTVNLTTEGGKIRAEANLDLAAQGSVTARLVTEQPRDLDIPDSGDFEVSLDEVKLEVFRAWYPEGVSLSGILSARSTGKLLPDRSLRLTAEANIARGLLIHRQKSGEIRAELRTAKLTADWRDQALKGAMTLELADTGHLTGNFSLPLPARLPTAMNREGTVSASLEGTVRENGILSALFPGMIQESKGELEVHLKVAETWQEPSFSGRLLLSQAGLYLPRAGVRLSDVKLNARLERDQITVESFSGRSGPGTISGTAIVNLKNWRLDRYQGTIRGNRFQFFYLPELQLLGSPTLDFTGTMDKVTVRGSFLIPELTAAGSDASAPVPASEDVVIVDAPRKKERTLPLELDVKIKVVLGDKVLVRMAGIDARLAGAVDVTITDPNDIRGKGVISTAKGSYKAYGVNLDIEKGRIIFDGGPVTKPRLDILAVRTVKDVTAGVIVVGTIQRPVIRLYSEPAMSDSDIMGYLVLGQPLSGDQGQINAVMQAAGLLLSASQTAILNEQIISKFGIDSLGVEQDKSDITQSIVTVGKYLTPKLFISYGRSLFSSTTYLKARYTFSERWEVETWTGTESGLDLFYRINFD